MVSKISRYANGCVSIDPKSKSIYFNLRKRNPLNLTSENSLKHTVVAGETLPAIAYKYYGKSSLYWVIMDANPTLMHIFDISAGDVLNVPSYSQVVRLVGRG